MPALLLVASMCIIAGCVGAHGSYCYTVTGRLVDSSEGQPLAGRRLAVVDDRDGPYQRFRFDPAEEFDFWPGFTRSDDQGRFEADVMAGEFTTYLLLGFIPLNWPSHLGPPLEVLRLHVKDNGVWRWKEIRTGPQCQTTVVGDVRYVRLGDIVLEPPAEIPRVPVDDWARSVDEEIRSALGHNR